MSDYAACSPIGALGGEGEDEEEEGGEMDVDLSKEEEEREDPQARWERIRDEWVQQRRRHGPRVKANDASAAFHSFLDEFLDRPAADQADQDRVKSAVTNILVRLQRGDRLARRLPLSKLVSYSQLFKCVCVDFFRFGIMAKKKVKMLYKSWHWDGTIPADYQVTTTTSPTETPLPLPTTTTTTSTNGGR
jgi:hypothetical protein